MRVVHIQDFGLHKKGDIVVVPDGSTVSPAYLAEVDDEDQMVGDATVPATATDKARGLDEPPPENDTNGDEAAEPEEAKKKGKG
jgi:hypothetical protein